jgi:hypothetical protein
MNSCHIPLTAESIAKALGCGQSGCTCGRPNGVGWMTHCPAHNDEHPSFSVSENNGKVLVKCFAGCSQDRVISALREKSLWPSGNGNQAKTRGLTLQQLADAKRLPGESLKRWGVADIDYKGRPAVYIPYRDIEGKITDRFRLNLKQEPRLIWRKGSKTLLYGLWRLHEFREAGKDILLFEGESDCWTCWEHNIAALGLPGKSTWKRAWAPLLEGLTVYLWQEPDAPELPGKVARDISGLLVIKAPDAFKDISEVHVAGQDVAGLIKELKAQAQPPEPGPGGKTAAAQNSKGNKGGNGEEEPTQGEILLMLAADAELFHNPDMEGFATFAVKNPSLPVMHRETWPIKSTGFRRWLAREFYQEEGKPPNSEAMGGALNILEAKAHFDGPEHDVYVRVASHLSERATYLDLGNPLWEAVAITPSGWQVISNPPVKFRRSRGMAGLYRPESGGKIGELRPFLNVGSDSDFRLIVGWLLAALNPAGPYPILVLQGEQGSAKSTAGRVIRSLVDPGTSPLRSTPREVRDVMISASNSWILAFDNLSGLPIWLSDVFCRLSTGGGFSTRELWTNGEEAIFDAMRPLILNGIDAIATRPDLADRSIIITLPQIDEGARRPEKEFWAAFEVAQPRIIGALLDGVSAGLRHINQVRLESYPRMADFCTWITACEPAFPWPPGSFMDAYMGNRSDAVEATLEADVVAVAVREFMADRETWEGSASTLLDELSEIAGEKVARGKAWPKAPNSLSNRLTRAATFLRAIGIEVDRGKSGDRFTSLTRKTRKKTVQAAQSAQAQEPSGFSQDDPMRDPNYVDDPTVQMDDPRTVQDDPHKRPSVRKAANGQGLDNGDDIDDKNRTFSASDENDSSLYEVEL